jgi:hypothetical protein
VVLDSKEDLKRDKAFLKMVLAASRSIMPEVTSPANAVEISLEEPRAKRNGNLLSKLLALTMEADRLKMALAVLPGAKFLADLKEWV